MKVNTYDNGDTFVYNDKDEIALSFIQMNDGRFELSVYDYDIIRRTVVYSRQNGDYHFTAIKND